MEQRTAEQRTAEKRTAESSNGFRIERTVTVNRPVEELYNFWRNPENIADIMDHLTSVKAMDGKRSHWVVKGPVGRRIEWDAEIVTEVLNELIEWQSIQGSDVFTNYAVHFRRAPGSRGTEVKIVLRYDPPVGIIGAAFTKLLGEAPSKEVREGLRRFKQLMEAGEFTANTGQSSGREA